MRDTKDLLHVLDEMSQPDIWAEVSPRAGDLRVDLDPPRPRSDPSFRRRVVIAVAALAVIIVPFVGLWLAFRSGSTPKPRVAPDTPLGLITYSAVVDGRWELLTVRPDGTGTTAISIAGLPENATHPSWSPDGSRIAFDAHSQGGSGTQGDDRDIYVVNADGSGLTRLTTSGGWDYLPSWSPDGSRIAFVHNTEGNDDVWIMDSNGDRPRRVTDDPALDLSPSWSPDGTRLAFISNRDGSPEIYTMGIDGSSVVRLTHDDAYEGSPAWSPDGGTIAFAGDVDGAGLYVMDGDGSNPRMVVAPSGQVGSVEGSWSPDGSSIAFVSSQGTDSPPILRSLDLATGSTIVLDSREELCCPSWSRQQAPSADSTNDPNVVDPLATSAMVPDVVGLPLEQAEQVIQEAGLVPDLLRGDPSVSGAVVIRLDPWAGTEVDAGFPVLITLSAAREGSRQAVSIDGLKFPVCRPVAIDGDFGGGMDRAWVFEEERVPGAGCVGSEGFQRLAVGSGDHAQLLSDRITDIFDDRAYKVWPYATPDLDGDGVDEIALAKGEAPGSRLLWFVKIVGNDLTPVVRDCSADCEPSWNPIIGTIWHANGTLTQGGMYCEPRDGGGQTVVEWESGVDDPLSISESRWTLHDQTVQLVSRRTYSVFGTPPPSGLDELCGRQVSLPGVPVP